MRLYHYGIICWKVVPGQYAHHDNVEDMRRHAVSWARFRAQLPVISQGSHCLMCSRVTSLPHEVGPLPYA